MLAIRLNYSSHEKCAFLWKTFNPMKIACTFPPFSLMMMITILFFFRASNELTITFLLKDLRVNFRPFLSFFFSRGDCELLPRDNSELSSSKLYIINNIEKIQIFAKDSFLLSFGSCSQSTPQKKKFNKKNHTLLLKCTDRFIAVFHAVKSKIEGNLGRHCSVVFAHVVWLVWLSSSIFL